MRLLSVISTSVLALAIATPVYAQQEQHDQKEEEKGKPAQENEKKAQQQDKNNKQEEKSAQQQGKNNQQEQKNAQQQNRNNQQEEKNAQQQHAQPAQRAGGNGAGRIPDDRYRANFGREHSFRVSEGDYRSHRFQYGGYWFGFEGVWPSNWLYTQNVFVIEIDGMYYLCNPMYPGVNIALDVTL